MERGIYSLTQCSHHLHAYFSFFSALTHDEADPLQIFPLHQNQLEGDVLLVWTRQTGVEENLESSVAAVAGTIFGFQLEG